MTKLDRSLIAKGDTLVGGTYRKDGNRIATGMVFTKGKPVPAKAPAPVSAAARKALADKAPAFASSLLSAGLAVKALKLSLLSETFRAK